MIVGIHRKIERGALYSRHTTIKASTVNRGQSWS